MIAKQIMEQINRCEKNKTRLENKLELAVAELKHWEAQLKELQKGK